MINKGKRKAIYITAAVLLLVVCAAGFIAYLALWGGNYIVFNVNPASNTITKVAAVEKTGGTIDLNAADINGILDLKTRNGITKSGFTVKKVYSLVEQNHISLYIPAAYKGFNILLYCNGTLSYENSKIIFVPSVFKIGKLNISKNFVMGKLKGISNDNMVVTSNEIEIGKDALPFDIQSLNVSGEVIAVSIQKSQIASTQSGSSSAASSGTAGGSTSGKTTSQQDILKRASRQLGGVYSSVKTQSEKTIIGEIRTTVNNMIQNPSYPYKSEANSVKAQYSKLSTDEKSDIQDAILTNMDMATLKQLRSTFGL